LSGQARQRRLDRPPGGAPGGPDGLPYSRTGARRERGVGAAQEDAGEGAQLALRHQEPALSQQAPSALAPSALAGQSGCPGLLPFRLLYVHTPFCRHKCGYCDFNAYAGMDRLMPEYQLAVERELEQAVATLPFGSLRTVYFGGGTPSLLPAHLAARMLAHVHATFHVESDAEITVQANPA